MSKSNDPPGIFLDASVLIAFLSREVKPEGFRRWWHVLKIIENAAKTNEPLLLSAFSIAEITGDRSRPDYASGDRQDRVRRFLRHHIFELVELDRNVGSTSREIMWAVPGIPPADAVQLASAIEAGCTRMLTYDDTHLLPLNGKSLPIADKEHDRTPTDSRNLTIEQPIWHEVPVQKYLLQGNDSESMLTIEHELDHASDHDLDSLIEAASKQS